MIRTKALTVFSIAGAAMLLAGLPAVADALTPQDAAKARHENFEKMGRAMKALNQELKASAPSKATMVTAAQTINGIARQQGGLFPPGSGPSAVKTDALDAVWTQRATFDAQMGKLVTESGKLATVAATGDVAAITAQFKATGAVCAACHRQFRKDND